MNVATASALTVPVGMDSNEPRCVVCQAPVAEGQALYPNSWEATVKTRLCCSEACRQCFSVDEHWLPSRPPPLADGADESRLVAEARARMARGDDLRVIVRDLLCSGVTREAIEHLLRMHEVRGNDARRLSEAAAPVHLATKAVTSGPLAALFSLFRGEAKRAQAARDSADAYAAVLEDLHTWSTRW